MKNHVSGVNAVLEQALGELEAEKDRIDGQITVVRSILNGAGPAAHSRRAVHSEMADPDRRVGAAPKTGRRPMSAAARREVSERMTRYWSGRRAAKAKAARIAARPKRVVRKAKVKPIVVRVVRKRRPVAKVVKRVARPVARKKPATRKPTARKVVVRKAVARKAPAAQKNEIAQVVTPVEV